MSGFLLGFTPVLGVHPGFLGALTRWHRISASGLPVGIFVHLAPGIMDLTIQVSALALMHLAFSWEGGQKQKDRVQLTSLMLKEKVLAFPLISFALLWSCLIMGWGHPTSLRQFPSQISWLCWHHTTGPRLLSFSQFASGHVGLFQPFIRSGSSGAGLSQLDMGPWSSNRGLFQPSIRS